MKCLRWEGTVVVRSERIMRGCEGKRDGEDVVGKTATFFTLHFAHCFGWCPFSIAVCQTHAFLRLYCCNLWHSLHSFPSLACLAKWCLVCGSRCKRRTLLQASCTNGSRQGCKIRRIRQTIAIAAESLRFVAKRQRLYCKPKEIRNGKINSNQNQIKRRSLQLQVERS